MRGNMIHEAGARAIKHALATNSSVTALDLSWNPLDRQGCYDMAEVLEVRQGLYSISS